MGSLLVSSAPILQPSGTLGLLSSENLVPGSCVQDPSGPQLRYIPRPRSSVGIMARDLLGWLGLTK